MKTETQDNDTTVRPDVISRLAPSGARVNAGRPTKAEAKHVQRYNLAIWRLMNGKGDVDDELAIVTGLSRYSLTRRAYRAQEQFSEKERDGQTGELSDTDIRYMRRAYGGASNPAVKAFCRDVCSVERN